MAHLPSIMAALLVLVLTVASHHQVSFWRSELTLWTRAVEMAPLKPRPRVNLASALLYAGELDAAEAELDRAVVLATQPHVPTWDRDDVAAFADSHRDAITILRAFNAR